MPQQKKDQQKRLQRASVTGESPFSIEQPADPKQAREWLQRVADHLSNFPNAGPPFLFVANAIKKFLSRENPLSKALGLAIEKKTFRGQPPTPDESVIRILEMLRPKGEKPISVSHIARATGVSKDTVETIRAARNKVFFAVPNSDRDEEGYIRNAEWEQAEKKAETVPDRLRSLIIAESAANINVTDLSKETEGRTPPARQPATHKRKRNPIPRKLK